MFVVTSWNMQLKPNSSLASSARVLLWDNSVCSDSEQTQGDLGQYSQKVLFTSEIQMHTLSKANSIVRSQN